MSITVTNDIRIEVESEYIPERSDPERGEYFFAYHVQITNEGDETVQLMSRRWVITDAEGKTEVVDGSGVVGEQPVLEPGESFEYSSFCPLPTEMGTMHGTYQMVTRGGESFDATIAPFTLVRDAIVLH